MPDTRCPACRRLEDENPAGHVTIDGQFFLEHRAEVLDRVKHRVEQASAEHPSQRVMTFADAEDSIQIATSDTRLARGIGEALQDAFHGTLDLRYEDCQQRLRVHWHR